MLKIKDIFRSIEYYSDYEWTMEQVYEVADKNIKRLQSQLNIANKKLEKEHNRKIDAQIDLQNALVKLDKIKAKINCCHNDEYQDLKKELSQLQQEKEEIIKWLEKRIKKLNSEYTVERYARLELMDILSKLKESDKNDKSN